MAPDGADAIFTFFFSFLFFFLGAVFLFSLGTQMAAMSTFLRFPGPGVDNIFSPEQEPIHKTKKEPRKLPDQTKKKKEMVVRRPGICQPGAVEKIDNEKSKQFCQVPSSVRRCRARPRGKICHCGLGFTI